MRHVARTNVSCHAHTSALRKLRISHVRYTNESIHTQECAMSHIWMCHVKYVHMSCHAYEWITSHTCEWFMSHSGPENPSWNLFCSYEKTKTVGPWSSGSIIVDLANTACIAKICVSLTQIQKLVRLQHSPLDLCTVCTQQRQSWLTFAPLQRIIQLILWTIYQ